MIKRQLLEVKREDREEEGYKRGENNLVKQLQRKSKKQP